MLLQPLTVVRLGQVPLAAALTWQEEMTARLAAGHGDDLLALAVHPPVYTVGVCAGATARAGAPGAQVDGAAVVAVARSGGTFWHGPGQLTVYFLRTLPRSGAGSPDVAGHLRGLHQALVQACHSLGVEVAARPGKLGVWAPVAPSAAPGGCVASMVAAAADAPEWRQVAQVGVQVVRGIARFGFALNIAPDLAPFAAGPGSPGSIPPVTSLAQLGYRGTPDLVAARLVQAIADVFGYIQHDEHWVTREEQMHRAEAPDA